MCSGRQNLTPEGGQAKKRFLIGSLQRQVDAAVRPAPGIGETCSMWVNLVGLPSGDEPDFLRRSDTMGHNRSGVIVKSRHAAAPARKNAAWRSGMRKALLRPRQVTSEFREAFLSARERPGMTCRRRFFLGGQRPRRPRLPRRGPDGHIPAMPESAMQCRRRVRCRRLERMPVGCDQPGLNFPPLQSGPLHRGLSVGSSRSVVQVWTRIFLETQSTGP